MKKILITGALGQIGSELTPFLRRRYGNENVVASDIKPISEGMINQNGPFKHIDCLDAQEIYSAIKKYKIDTVFHLAAILSASGEKNPQLAWKVNINGLYNVLEIAREQKCAVFTPSSIAAFGPSTPKDNTPRRQFKDPILYTDYPRLQENFFVIIIGGLKIELNKIEKTLNHTLKDLEMRED